MKSKIMVFAILGLAGVSLVEAKPKMEEKKINKENEIMILGSYFDFNNSFSKMYTLKLNPIPIPDPIPDGPIPDPDPIPNPNPIPDPGLVIVDWFPVVKEAGVIVREKNIVGDMLRYDVSGDIMSTGQAALWMTDKNTNVYNYNTLDTTGYDYTVEVEGQAHFENNGIILGNNGGVEVLGGASILNNGDIKNIGNYGILVYETGSEAINSQTGIIENTGAAGIYVANGAKGSNDGIIKNKSDYGFYVSGSDAVGINNVTGVIENIGHRGMYSEYGGKTVNYGLIENTSCWGMLTVGLGSEAVNEVGGIVRNGTYQGYTYDISGMQASSGAKATNKGSVENIGMYGMAGSGAGSEVINESTGVVANTAISGMYVENGAKATNYGLIKNGIVGKTNSGQSGMEISGTGSVGINEATGVIQNIGYYGMYASNGSGAINKGRIENNFSYGMYGSGTGTALTNENTGIIANDGSYGMTLYSGATGINNGTISNTGDYGMYLSSGSTGVNNGTIHITGDNKTGVNVSNSTFTNNGTILMEGKNTTAIRATSNSTVKIASGSEIILKNGSTEDTVTQGTTDFTGKGTGNISTNGKFYDLDSTSTLINAGTVSTNNVLSIQGGGKFVLDSETGSLNAEILNLEDNLYVNASVALNSSDDVYTNNGLDVNEITGDGKVVSDSKLFSASINDKNVVTLTRNNFENVFVGDLGTVLENNYTGSESNEEQNKIYNSLKSITKDDKIKDANTELMGQASVENQMYQQFTLNKIIDRGIEKILNKRDENNNGFYVNFLGSKSEVDSKDDSIGFKGDFGGVIIGGMKNLDETTSIGGFLTYLDSHYDYKDTAKSVQDTETWSLTGVVEKELSNNFKWTTKVGYNKNTNDVNRKITYDNSNRDVNGEFDSWSLSGSTVIEYTKKINDRISLKPSAGVILDYISQDSYNESGADGLNLNVDSSNGLSSRIGVGLEAEISAYKNLNHEVKIIPRIDYLYELGDPYGDKTVSMEAFSDNMDVWSRNAGRNDLNLGIDLQYEYRDNLMLFTGYSAGVLEDNKTQSVNAGFKFTF